LLVTIGHREKEPNRDSSENTIGNKIFYRSRGGGYCTAKRYNDLGKAYDGMEGTPPLIQRGAKEGLKTRLRGGDDQEGFSENLEQDDGD